MLPANVLKRLLTGFALTSAALSVPARAEQINTGDPTGAYHSSFCPALAGELGKAKFDYTCQTSAGTLENMQRVAANPRQIGFAQADVYALEAPSFGATKAFQRVRTDDARECVFAVTRAKELTNYGEIAVNAAKLRFILPPKSSGSAGTFKFLQSIDAQGLGTAKDVRNADTTDEAIRQALSADDTVAVFVQFPDPDNVRFKMINDLGGRILPVLDRNILRQQVEGQKIYYALETQVTNAKWLKSGEKVVTSCTPLVIFTGNPDAIKGGDKAVSDQRDLIRTLEAMPASKLLPEESTAVKLLKRTKELSAAGVEKLVALADEARKDAKPYLERATDIGKQAMEKAGPALKKAEETAASLYEKAAAEVRALIAKAREKAAP